MGHAASRLLTHNAVVAGFAVFGPFLFRDIYKTGSRQGLIVAMNAALPFMDGEMRGFAARTLSKVEAMTEAEFAGLPIYAADEV